MQEDSLFLDAFFKKGILDSNIKDKNLSLINSMNKKNKRNNFIQSPNHNIKITPYWLLGLIEGEGSFCVTKKNKQIFLTQHFN